MRASGEGLRFRHVFVAAAKLSDDENTAETAGWSSIPGVEWTIQI